MLTVEEWVDKVHEITDKLESESAKKMHLEIQSAKAYHDGYVQACEDFGRCMRENISQEQG